MAAIAVILTLRRALEEARTKQAEDERAAEEESGLLPRVPLDIADDLLHILAA